MRVPRSTPAKASARLPVWCLRRDALREELVALLEAARQRTFDLLATLPDEALTTQHSPLMSPPVWDLAHVANYEEQWLLGALGAGRLVPPGVDALYDALRHPRASRMKLPLMDVPSARNYLAQVRTRVLAQLARTSFSGAAGREDPLRHAAFVYGLVLQHEHQHAETLLATLQLMTRWRFAPAEGPKPRGRRLRRRQILVPGGPFVMGTDDDPWAYDNERPAHVRELPPFLIDAAPVTNAQYQAFIEDGGYQRREFWSEAGWSHCSRERLQAPLFWTREGKGWMRRRFARHETLPPDEPVQHVCWYEADAFARWAKKRLPTEAEWEKAASWDGAGKRRYPWGEQPPTAQRANLWIGLYGPSPAGAFPEGATAAGAEQLLGDVWEWTASDFAPYPGFRPFPYREYSAPFFDGRYKVLRGGAWATHPLAMRNTFRNWDFPERRQIFAGFRCAQDV